MDLLQKKLVEMLGQSTGSTLCDSGGAYGRRWERNQKFLKEGGKFEALPKVSVDIDGEPDSIKPEKDTFGVSVAIELYHFLYLCLDYDKDYEKFNKAMVRFQTKDGFGFDAFERFIETKTGNKHLRNLFNASSNLEVNLFEDPVNTYNGEDALTQTLWYRRIRLDGTEHVLISIHQGCDVRGGYTDPVLFPLSADERLYNNNQVRMQCACEEWDSYNAGYSWDSQCTNQEEMVCKDQLVFKDGDKTLIDKNLNNFSDFPYNRFRVEEKDGKKSVYCRRCNKEVTFSM